MSKDPFQAIVGSCIHIIRGQIQSLSREGADKWRIQGFVGVGLTFFAMPTSCTIRGIAVMIINFITSATSASHMEEVQ